MSFEKLANFSNKTDLYPDSRTTLVSPDDELKRGIWPRSLALWMAAFYASLYIIRPWEELFPSLAGIHLMKIYAVCLIAVVFFNKKNRFQMDFQALTILFFTLALAISAVFAIYPPMSWPSFWEFLTVVVFYFILILVARTPYELFFLVTCYIVTMAVYLAKSQWEYFVHGAHRYDPGTGIVRMCGIESTFGGPNALAMSIVVSLPFLLLIWSIRKEFTEKWPHLWRKWFPRFLVFYAALAVSSVILTNSRSGMLCFVLFAVMVMLRGKGIGGKIGTITLGIIILAGIWLVMPQENRNRFRSIWDPSAGTHVAQKDADARVEGFWVGIEMFEDFPLTGVGINNGKRYRRENIDERWEQTHNLIGQVLGETGIVGGLTFSLMVIVMVFNSRRVRMLGERNGSDLKLKALSRLGLACRDAVILLFFEGLFGHNLLRFNWLWFAAFSVLALQFAQSLQSTNRRQR